MADYTKREEVARRTVYALPNPTNWAEVSKVFVSIHQEFPDATTDDAVIIEGDEEEILIVVGDTRWKMEKS